MFCTIITFLIWFGCCYFQSVCMKNLRGRKKAFGKFNFIAFSCVNVWGTWDEFGRIFEGARWNERNEVECSYLTTSLHPIETPHAREMCLQIYLFATELKFLPYASTETNVHKTRSIKYCIVRVFNFEGEELKWICKLSVKKSTLLLHPNQNEMNIWKSSTNSIRGEVNGKTLELEKRVFTTPDNAKTSQNKNYFKVFLLKLSFYSTQTTKRNR